MDRHSPTLNPAIPESVLFARELADHALQEIRFFTYRLDVLRAWPPSSRRSALITATEDRLRRLGQLT
jgi:hypothetical protein